MQSKIRPLSGEDAEFVLNTISNHKEWYGTCETIDFIHAHFYGVYGSDNELYGFFSMCTWGYDEECLLACVYVKEECRKQGLFKKMVNFAKNKAYDYPLITIGAMKDNVIANKIYNKMFAFSHYDEELDGNFYIIKDKRL